MISRQFLPSPRINTVPEVRQYDSSGLDSRGQLEAFLHVVDAAARTRCVRFIPETRAKNKKIEVLKPALEKFIAQIQAIASVDPTFPVSVEAQRVGRAVKTVWNLEGSHAPAVKIKTRIRNSVEPIRETALKEVRETPLELQQDRLGRVNLGVRVRVANVIHHVTQAQNVIVVRVRDDQRLEIAQT